MGATIAAGVILRKAPLGLPFPVTKWGGSWLWGMMIWCAVAIPSNGRHPLRTACTAIVLATLTECLKRLHTPALDHVRSGPLGSFLLGHHFAVADLVVYALAITSTAFLASRHNHIRAQTDARRHDDRCNQ